MLSERPIDWAATAARGYADRGEAVRPHAGLGIASCVAAVMGTVSMAVLVVMVRAISATDSNAGVEGSPLSYTVGAVFFGAVVVSLCGIALAIGGMRQRNRRRQLAIAGLIGNILLPLGVVVVSIMGAAYSHQAPQSGQWAEGPSQRQSAPSSEDSQTSVDRAFQNGRMVGRITGFALAAVALICLGSYCFRIARARPITSFGVPGMIAEPARQFVGNRVGPPPLPTIPRTVPPLPVTADAAPIGAAACGLCKVAAPEPGYSAKLCAPCRRKLAQTPVPQWIMVMCGLIIAAVAASLMWCGPSLDAAIAMERGRRAYAAGDYARAAAQYRLAVDQYPDAVAPTARLGLALYHEGHDDEAAEEFRRLAGKKDEASFVNEVNMAISDIAARRMRRANP